MPLLRVRVLTERVPASTREVVEQSQSLLSFRSTSMRNTCLEVLKNADDELPPLRLTRKQRLALTVGTALSEVDALGLNPDNLTFEFLCEKGVRMPNVRAAGLCLRRLRRLGATPAALRSDLDLTPLDLVLNPNMAKELISAYGDEVAIHAAYCASSADAILFAGSTAANAIGLTTDALLTACAGDARAAMEVLRQLNPNRALIGVHVSTLVSCGILSGHLSAMGIPGDVIRAQVLRDAPIEAVSHNLF